MDTTSLSFHGAGGESLGAYGHSKDHRPDLRQMVLAVVLDGEGRPVCTEMLPGNAADTTVLLPIVDRLRKRFWIARVCVMADRGMISAATIAALEERGLDYIRCVPFLTSPRLLRLADGAGLLRDPDRAVARIRSFLRLQGIED